MGKYRSLRKPACQEKDWEAELAAILIPCSNSTIIRLISGGIKRVPLNFLDRDTAKLRPVAMPTAHELRERLRRGNEPSKQSGGSTRGCSHRCLKSR